MAKIRPKMHKNTAQDGHDEAQDGQDEAQDGQDEAQDRQDEAQDSQDATLKKIVSQDDEDDANKHF